MSEEVAAECRADGHAANAIEVVEAHGGGHEAIVGAHECHDDITAEHIDLGESHILVFVLCGGDEIKHGRRSLHVEETTHQSAEHAGADLCGQGRPQPYLPLLSSLGHPSSKIGDYIGPLICFAGLGRG